MSRNTDLESILFDVDLRPIGFVPSDAAEGEQPVEHDKELFPALERIDQYQAVVRRDTGTVFSIVSERYKLQFHHIFPQGLLRGKRRPAEINDIANFAFFGGRTNRKLGAMPPARYLPTLVDSDPALAKAQCIPEDRALWEGDRHLDFLAARRKLIAERLNQFLRVKAP